MSANGPLKGVNLGGWLVLEKWMTPTLFRGTDAKDEYELLQTPGATKKLRAHHRTFIQEDDFRWLHDNGVTAVRIPVGYWVLNGDGPLISAKGRLDWAFRMAKKYHIQVLLCLHGAPGSQNGQDHSGRVGRALWYKKYAYRQQTISILEEIALRYRDEPQFWGIELLNEPKFGILQLKLRRFYRGAYSRLRQVLRPTTIIMFHDAFTPRLMSGALIGATHPIGMDVHWYHFSFWAYRWTPLAWYWRVVAIHGRLLQQLAKRQPVIVGEWSGVISHRTLRRYPAMEHESLQLEHVARQSAAYQSAHAWFYWSYKTEAPGIWNFRSLKDGGVLF